MKINRKHVLKGISPYARVEFKTIMLDIDMGNQVEKIDFEVPKHFSEVAAKKLVEQFAYLYEIPALTTAIQEQKIPIWLSKKRRTNVAQNRRSMSQTLPRETSVKQIFDRIAGHYTYHAVKLGYFDQEVDARNFYDELRLLFCQQAIFPVLETPLDLGISWAYGERLLAAHFERIKAKGEQRYCAMGKSHFAEEDGQYLAQAFLKKSTQNAKSEIVLEKSSTQDWQQYLKQSKSIISQPKLLKIGQEYTYELLQNFYQQLITLLDEDNIIEMVAYHELTQPLIAAQIDDAEITKCLEFAKQQNLNAFENHFSYLKAPFLNEESNFVYGYNFDQKNAISSFSDAHDRELIESEMINQNFHDQKVNFYFNGAISEDARSKPLDPSPIWHNNDSLSEQKTVCQKVTINLEEFVDEFAQFDCDRFEHTVHIATIFANISIDLAQYNDPQIKEASLNQRPIGINISNGASMLMAMGIGYDTDVALALMAHICQLSSNLTALSSSQLAQKFGAFEDYSNHKALLNHKVTKLQISKLGKLAVFQKQNQQSQNQLSYLIDPKLHNCCKDNAIHIAGSFSKFGFRNASLSIMTNDAVSQTILDCSSDGAKPVIRLIEKDDIAPKANKLKGFVKKGLKALGYTQKQICQIEDALLLKPSFKNSPHFNHEILSNNGISKDIIALFDQWAARFDKVERIISATQLTALFGEVTDLEIDEYQKASLNRLIKALTSDQIEALDDYLYRDAVCTSIPHLDPLDYHVFFNQDSDRFTQLHRPLASAQINMISACQHFIDQAVNGDLRSNKPKNIEDFKALIDQAKMLKLKNLSFDFFEPKKDDIKGEKISTAQMSALIKSKNLSKNVSASIEEVVEIDRNIDENIVHLDEPNFKRQVLQKSLIHSNHFFIDGELVILNHSTFDDDGELNYLKIDMPEQSLNVKDLLNQFSKSISFSLQNGIRLSQFANLFIGNHGVGSGKVEPQNDIDKVNSVLDFAFQYFCGKYDPSKPTDGDLANISDLTALEKAVPAIIETQKKAEAFIQDLLDETSNQVENEMDPPCPICGQNKNAHDLGDTICLRCKKTN